MAEKEPDMYDVICDSYADYTQEDLLAECRSLASANYLLQKAIRKAQQSGYRMARMLVNGFDRGVITKERFHELIASQLGEK